MTKPESLETSSGLAKMDALAARLIARARPIRFGVAQSPAELEAVHRLRYRIVIERGWAKSQDFPDGLERDAHDARAIQIAAWDGDLLAATSRLVIPAPGHPMPTEEAFSLEINPDRRVADVGRVCVAPAYRNVQQRVFWGLLGRTWIEMRIRGFSEAYTILTPSVARMYRSWGLQVLQLSAPCPHWGEERYPALIRPGESAHTLIRTTERFGMEPEGSTLRSKKGSRRGLPSTADRVA